MNNPQELSALVSQARDGDLDAFEALVRRFQNMAVGYAHSLLDDWAAAQDAAQEAFIQVYADLPKLRAPEAFLTWFRQIVFKHCDRIRRTRRFDWVSLDTAAKTIGNVGVPARAAEDREDSAVVAAALASLPKLERATLVLFYYQDASLRDIAEFLGISESSVDHRLRSARKHLGERMLVMTQQDLLANRPSNDTQFVLQVMDGLTRLSNPRGLEARLPEEIELSRATRQGFGLVLFDLDAFTAFNQQWGHVAGDGLVAALSRQMQASLTSADFVARYGGQEFALVIRRGTPQAVLEIADQIREAIAATEFRLGDLLRPAARYPAGEMLLPASAANEEFRRGLRCLQANKLTEAKQAFEAALALDSSHVPSIMEQAYLELRQTLEPARLAEPFRVTLSGGVAWYQANDTPATLIERAVQALGQAKQSGRNRVGLAA